MQLSHSLFICLFSGRDVWQGEHDCEHRRPGGPQRMQGPLSSTHPGSTARSRAVLTVPRRKIQDTQDAPELTRGSHFER